MMTRSRTRMRETRKKIHESATKKWTDDDVSERVSLAANMMHKYLVPAHIVATVSGIQQSVLEQHPVPPYKEPGPPSHCAAFFDSNGDLLDLTWLLDMDCSRDPGDEDAKELDMDCVGCVSDLDTNELNISQLHIDIHKDSNVEHATNQAVAEVDSPVSSPRTMQKSMLFHHEDDGKV